MAGCDPTMVADISNAYSDSYDPTNPCYDPTQDPNSPDYGATSGALGSSITNAPPASPITSSNPTSTATAVGGFTGLLQNLTRALGGGAQPGTAQAAGASFSTAAVPQGAILQYAGTWYKNGLSFTSLSSAVSQIKSQLVGAGLAVLSYSDNTGLMTDTFGGSFNVVMQIQIQNGTGFGSVQDVNSIVQHWVYQVTGTLPSGGFSTMTLPNGTTISVGGAIAPPPPSPSGTPAGSQPASCSVLDAIQGKCSLFGGNFGSSFGSTLAVGLVVLLAGVILLHKVEASV